MAKALQRRNLLIRTLTKLKLQARKQNSPAKGVVQTLEEKNRSVLAKALAKAQQQ